MWNKLDDKLHNHRKARKAGLEAMGLWVVCLSYCGDQLTDGFVPAWYVATWLPGRKGVQLAERLVTAGLWERAELDDEKGWVFHDYHEQNPTRQKVLDDREKEKERKAEQRKAARLEAERKAAEQREAERLAAEHAATNGQVSQSVSHPDNQQDSGAVSEDPDPTRLDPTRSSSGSFASASVALPTQSVTQQESGTALECCPFHDFEDYDPKCPTCHAWLLARKRLGAGVNHNAVDDPWGRHESV